MIRYRKAVITDPLAVMLGFGNDEKPPTVVVLQELNPATNKWEDVEIVDVGSEGGDAE